MPQPIIIARREVMHGGVQLSTVEPCAATFGNVVVCTGSRFIRMSIDGGVNFPSNLTLAGNSVFGGGICFDQSAMWIPQISRVAWVMLAGNGDLRMRLAVTSSERLTSSGGQNWIYLELLPTDLKLSGMVLDYPQLALGARMLYITMKFFRPGEKFIAGTAIIRISLDQLAREEPSTIGFDYFATSAVRNFCVAQNIGGIALWAGSINNRTLRLYSWDESGGDIFWSDVGMPAYNDSPAAYTSLTPDGNDWLSKSNSPPTNADPQNALDYRITGGARVSSSNLAEELVFAWTAGRNPPERPEPYVYLAMLRFDRGSRATQLVGTRDIYHPELAWAFPALGGLLTENGYLAMSVAWGGGNKFFVNHAVGFVDLPIADTSRFENFTIARSTAGAPRWGDFVCVRDDASSNPHAYFVTAGFSIDASAKQGAGASSSIYMVQFTPVLEIVIHPV